mgnify:CR=1 FL=1
MQKAKKEIEDKIAVCRLKLERAQQLLAMLGGEKERWTNKATELGERFTALVGDMLLASAAISYLGPFSAAFRSAALQEW